MASPNDKQWTNFTGGKATADVRKITVQIQDALLETLSVSTKNEDVSITPFTLKGKVLLVQLYLTPQTIPLNPL